MANGYGMGAVDPQQSAPAQALGVALGGSGGYSTESPLTQVAAMPNPAVAMQEHSPTSTAIAMGEALGRLAGGVRRGEYQMGSSSMRVEQLMRAGMNPTEIQILLRSEGE